MKVGRFGILAGIEADSSGGRGHSLGFARIHTMHATGGGGAF